MRVEWVVDDLSEIYLFFWGRGENNPLKTIYLSLAAKYMIIWLDAKE